MSCRQSRIRVSIFHRLDRDVRQKVVRSASARGFSTGETLRDIHMTNNIRSTHQLLPDHCNGCAKDPQDEVEHALPTRKNKYKGQHVLNIPRGLRSAVELGSCPSAYLPRPGHADGCHDECPKSCRITKSVS